MEGENDEDDDGFYVPHGYLSEGEGDVSEQEMEADVKVCVRMCVCVAMCGRKAGVGKYVSRSDVVVSIHATAKCPHCSVVRAYSATVHVSGHF